jgi:hypothetical protein
VICYTQNTVEQIAIISFTPTMFPNLTDVTMMVYLELLLLLIDLPAMLELLSQ